jgi:uridylate kinase
MDGGTSMESPAYQRIVLKISGEALAGEKGYGIDQNVVDLISDQVIEIRNMGVQVAIVVGGGNIWRGRSGIGMDRTTADHMGMLATVINALALQDALENKNIETRVQTAIEMRQIAEPYIRRRAVRHLEKGRVVIFACGTGNPYFSTDTAAALRAAEIEAQVILLAKNIDGVYDDDPKKNSNASKFDKISYIDVINRGLGVMDTTAITLCMDNKIPIVVFGLKDKDSIKAAVLGRKIGTTIEEV